MNGVQFWINIHPCKDGWHAIVGIAHIRAETNGKTRSKVWKQAWLIVMKLFDTINATGGEA